jgi:hypothetical protein
VKGIFAHADEELRIVQPSALRLRFEIRTGDSIIASLSFHRFLGSRAYVESENGSWTFRRTGFLPRRISIQVADQEMEIAVYVENMWTKGGTLRLLDGREFRVRANFWLTRFEILSPDGSVMVRYTGIRGFLHRSAAVRILPEAGALEELPWLVPLGWYIAVMALRSRSARAG